MNIVTKKNLIVANLKKPDGTPLDNITKTKLLGVILSDNMKWDLHMDYILPRASKSVFLITTLKSLNVSALTLWQVYFAITRSILTYGYPAMCNMTHKLFARLERVERRVIRIIGSNPPVNIAEFCKNLCISLANSIKKRPHHPLHNIFMYRQSIGRLNSSCCAPFARTTRYKNSLIKFA